MRIGIIEPHLLRFGGIRRMVEFANGLVDLGHDVTFYLPPAERMRCAWMQCHAHIRPLVEGYAADLDVVIANEETQWHLLSLFDHARRTVFYLLHAGATYGKPGSWESVRTPVHAQLANSEWTADRAYETTGIRPTVVLGGVNRSMFHPVPGPTRYPILCVGDTREWKGTATIEVAARQLDVPVERYGPKALPQSRMAAEISAAEVFVVGSWYEGFCQPGLEALACGTPLVTTDNGGCREYAIHEETALVVPARDPRAMADAIARLRTDRELRARLSSNGLDLVRDRFDWGRATARLEAVLSAVVDGPDRTLDVSPNQRSAPAPDPILSIVVLAWNGLPLTQACVESIRSHTKVPYELIIVDNGSEHEAAAYAEQAADVPVLLERNLGFSKGMNAGLAAARGAFVAFVNNDTEVPAGWDRSIVDVFDAFPSAGIVVPAVTNAGNQRTVRMHAGNRVETLSPFEAPPSAVVFVMPRSVATELGGWGEEYPIASAEDVDLCFKVWVNGLDIVFDERVLVQHVGKASASRLDDWEAQWARNRAIFLAKWTSERPGVPRLESCSEADFERNLQIARSVAAWMERYFSVRKKVPSWVRQPSLRVLRPIAARTSRFLYQRRDDPRVKRLRTWADQQPRVRRFVRRIGGTRT